MIADLIRRMTAAGAPMDAVMIAVEAIEDLQKADQERREKRAAQKRKERGSPAVARPSRDNEATVATLSRDDDAARAFILGKISSIPPSPPKGGSSPQGVRPPKRGGRLPTDWTPTQADREYATGQGLSSSAIKRETEKFRDWWHAAAGSRARKHDWSATWRTWVRKAVDDRPYDRPPPRAGPRSMTLAEMSRMDEPGFSFGDPRDEPLRTEPQRAEPRPRDEPAASPANGDARRSGFVGRVSFEDRDDRRHHVVDH